MALPQGINFRDTLGYVTDGANEDAEIPTGNATYPRTTAQGNNVGWETAVADYSGRNRDSGNDPRIAGLCFNPSNSVTYRIDLPATGNYKVGIAAGDAGYANNVAWDLYDQAASHGNLTTGTTSAANRFKDATDTELTNVTWPTNQTLVQFSFSSTILRLEAQGAAQVVAHLYVEAVAAATTPSLTRLTASPLRWR